MEGSQYLKQNGSLLVTRRVRKTWILSGCKQWQSQNTTPCTKVLAHKISTTSPQTPYLKTKVKKTIYLKKIKALSKSGKFFAN